jgi:hypothetical protein
MFMKQALVLSLVVFAALGACSPKAEPNTEAKIVEPPKAVSAAPDVAAAEAAGTADPRIPTVDPASINDQSPTADVMHAYVIPGSETLFAAESEDPPTDDAGWARLRTAAQNVITGAEMLKAPVRAQGRDGWVKAADMVIEATRKTSEALAKNNADELVFTDGDMMTGCTECHQKFRDMQVPEGHLVDGKTN